MFVPFVAVSQIASLEDIRMYSMDLTDHDVKPILQTMLNSKALLLKAERNILQEVNTFESDSLAKS